MRTVGWILSFLLAVFIVSMFFRACNWAGKAVDVVGEQIDPKVMLKKYEWFKDVAAELDARKANVDSYNEQFKQMDSLYGPRNKWSRADAENYNLRQSEFLGIKQSYNVLAAEYNAAMAKINYRFCNVGTLPAGAAEPLPREYRTYL